MTQAPRLRDSEWRIQYTSDDDDLVGEFYVPALRCAVSYDRATGFFEAKALRIAAQGIEGLVGNDGRMRLVVGCTLAPDEIEAISRGLDLRRAIEQHLQVTPLFPPDAATHDALELLAWMVAHQRLDVKVAVPCDDKRRPIAAGGLFHDKSGIIADATDDRLAFIGSVNETRAGWTTNWESYDVFLSWKEEPRVRNEAEKFDRLWNDTARRVRTVDIPEAVRQDLLRFLPTDDQPARLSARDRAAESPPPAPEGTVIAPAATEPRDDERFTRVWAFINHAAQREGDGIWVGPATAAVDPWPHQLRAYTRMWSEWPPRLLIADEVGLGKTVQAGLLLRQAWLSGRARRILVMAPKGVLTQWQAELREKFNLHWPIYDGHALQYPASPAWAGRTTRPVARKEWLAEPAVLVSSHLLRRRERAKDLLDAEPWDLVILDEAHHARRRGAGAAPGGGDKGPNALLELMQQLAPRTGGLVLLTATPMQVHPIEVWDLLQLLGLPPEWTAQEFLTFYDRIAEAPTADKLEGLARLFQSLERQYGPVTPGLVERAAGVGSFRAKKLLGALRDSVSLVRRQLSPEERQQAYAFLRTQTPVRRLVSRHTRELLRRYHREGKLKTRIADRLVRDDFITMTSEERAVYEAVEDYITSTYNAAGADERNAVGFVMTIYRRRLASSFAALAETLSRRLAAMRHTGDGAAVTTDDLEDDELAEGPDDESTASSMSAQALRDEEAGSIERLLQMVRALPPDTKLSRLIGMLERLREAGHTQAMIFTQYADTMYFLREALAREGERRGWSVMSYAGDGGGVRDASSTWTTVSRDEAKRRFKAGKADLLVCTDAAAEGLNFQFCGALVNYDMPWNPMRVEQRIGRIDRLGQKFEQIQIVNLHLSDTVETDVYRALRSRIGLFTNVVGKLQPILAQLPGTIRSAVLTGADRRTELRQGITDRIGQDIDKAKEAKFDLDEDAVVDFDVPSGVSSPVSLPELWRVLGDAALLPDGVSAKPMGGAEVWYEARSLTGPVRVTTAPEYYGEHPDSVEFWSPGGPVFPPVEPSGAAPNVGRLGDLLD